MTEPDDRDSQVPPTRMRRAADEPDSMPGDTRGCTVAILLGLAVGLLVVAVVTYLIIRTFVH